MRIVAIIALLILAAAGGVYWFYADEVAIVAGPAPVPPEVAAGEDALALPGLVAMMHADVGHIVAVERAALGEEDREALLGPALKTHPVLGVFHQNGIDLREAIDHAVAGLVVTDGSPSVATLLYGRFDLGRVREALPRAFEVTSSRIAAESVLVLKTIDRDSCKVSAPIAVHLTDGRIVAAPPGLIGSILERLRAAAGGETDLGKWRAYRAGRLLSIGLFVPPLEAGKAVENGYARLAARAGKDALSSVSLLFAGVRVAPRSAGLDVNFHAELHNADAPREAVAAYEKWQRDLTRETEAKIPSLAKLREYVKVVADGERLDVDVALNKDLLNDVGRVPAELLTLVFSSMGANSASLKRPTPGAERIVAAEKLLQYDARLSHDQLKPFAATGGPEFKTETKTGPFGIRIKSYRLSAEDPDTVELEVETRSGELSNVDVDSMHRIKDDARAQLFVTAVRGRDGANLQRENDCGKWRAERGAGLAPRNDHRFVDKKFVRVPAVGGGKTVRLKPGARLADIASLEGHVRLRLPTEVETRRVEAPFKDKIVEAPGLRVRLADGGPGSVKYEISGGIDRVLSVRALNGQGRYLATAESYSSGRFLGSGKTVGRSFAGRPQSAEFVIAMAEEAKEYGFTIASVRPGFSKWGTPKPYTVAAIGRRAFNRQFARFRHRACKKGVAASSVRPFRICAENLIPGWRGGLRGSFIIAAPASNALLGNLSAVELVIERVTVAGPGRVRDRTTKIELRRYTEFRKARRKGVLDNRFNPYLSMDEDKGFKGKTITGARGRLIARLPGRLSALTLDAADLGSRADHPSGISARLIEFSDGGIKFEIKGPRDRLVQFVPRDSGGKALATNVVTVKPAKQPGLWHGRFRVSGRPATVDLVIADRQDVIEYPFKVRFGK